jgi:hypothetical protein
VETLHRESYERAWQAFKQFLRPSAIPFDQASVEQVADYLSHLFKKKLEWSTINTHRSAISMTLAPVDGVSIGEHPFITRLMRGVFTKRPQRYKIPVAWDPNKVLDVFQHWPIPLPLSHLIRKGAFLLAIVLAKRAHDLVFLRSDANHLHFEGDALCFIPSRLSKTDRPSHICPPFFVKPWKKDLSICPVEVINIILNEKSCLQLKHDFIFFNWNPPFELLDTAAFRRCIQFCLTQAGIDATPGSTRSVASSAALLHGASVGDVFHLGDWSNASTFFRFYSSL